MRNLQPNHLITIVESRRFPEIAIQASCFRMEAVCKLASGDLRGFICLKSYIALSPRVQVALRNFVQLCLHRSQEKLPNHQFINANQRRVWFCFSSVKSHQCNKQIPMQRHWRVMQRTLHLQRLGHLNSQIFADSGLLSSTLGPSAPVRMEHIVQMQHTRIASKNGWQLHNSFSAKFVVTSQPTPPPPPKKKHTGSR